VAEFSGEPPEVFTGRHLSDICPELHDALVSGLSVGEIPVTLFKRSHIIGFTKFELNSSYPDSAGCIVNFKDLTEDLKLRKELRHKERLSAMGEVVASVAHEMRNPLFAISSVAQILEMELSLKPAHQELMSSLLKESRRINNLVEELLDSTRELRLQRKTVDLNGIVAESLLVLKSISDDKRVLLRSSSFAERIMIHADSGKVEQVMINLVKNAIEASSEGSQVDLTIEEGADEVMISITDCGKGIAADVFDQIFDVFFTTKRGGTGLGLSICRNIIEAHGGTLTASNNPGTGATFTIRLPFAGDNQ
jgi:signal transduction histidine kinase